MPNKPLPAYASQWIAQWKQAAPRLQAIRDEELRRLGSAEDVASSFGDTSSTNKFRRRSLSQSLIFDRNPERNGMVIMQRWFMRRHLLEQMRGDRAKA